MMWALHNAARYWCQITSVETGGSVHTRCRGRWSGADEYREDPDPPYVRRCRGCMAAVVNAPAVNFGFDLTETESV